MISLKRKVALKRKARLRVMDLLGGGSPVLKGEVAFSSTGIRDAVRERAGRLEVLVWVDSGVPAPGGWDDE